MPKIASQDQSRRRHLIKKLWLAAQKMSSKPWRYETKKISLFTHPSDTAFNNTNWRNVFYFRWPSRDSYYTAVVELPIPYLDSTVSCRCLRDLRLLSHHHGYDKKKITVADLSARTKANHYQRGIYLSCHANAQHAKPAKGRVHLKTLAEERECTSPA